MKSKRSIEDSELIIEQLRAENELKTKWLSLIAHNCKGLYSNIKYLLNAMADESITSDVFMSMLPELSQIAERNSKTMQSTFAWINAQTDGFNLDIKPTLIHSLFLDVIEGFVKEISAKELSLKFVGDEETLFNTDRFLIRFILKLLVDNAIKYSNKGGAIEVIVYSDSEKASITVKDSGVGMNHSRLRTIGTLDGAPYTGTMEEKGSGLSLVIVKEFVEMLNGKMNVSSVEDKGTSVEIVFPINN
ncbi:MAG: HAMP domain-containing sensor histidine kinase [Dysgonamonadaceae bacterium]|nr:HAMP domain-containing sensor histidine kinase [Dysgonamonadaceae bacterium]MDD4727364.1 HAMP domain-containing sensor histidine kinase [Dysgonamonadaceae bacterium]